MKRIALLSLLILLIPLAAVHGQTPATAVTDLEIEFWPDYDRPEVLVLITGTLPPATPLPAQVSIPLSRNADLNAVARIDDTNTMVDDIPYETSGDTLTLTTPDPRFRVEYYIPYTEEGEQHSFTFTWLADITVEEVNARIQEPLSATTVVAEPAPVDVVSGQDGFSYHLLPNQIVPAGQPYAVTVTYDMTSPALSVDQLGNVTVDLGAPETEEGFFATTNWPVIVAAVGGILIAAVVVWQVTTSRQSKRPRKPQPVRAGKQSQTKFCHNCGERLEPGDKFCRNCGTRVKGQ